jgi:hypothetical protein
MPHSFSPAPVAAVNRDELMGHMVELARWTKLAGTREELQSLRFFDARMQSYGYRTDLVLHDAFISLPGKAHVAIDNQSVGGITHSFSLPSPAEGLTAPVVYVGAGRPPDFADKDLRGCIALIDGMATPATARQATLAGAAGQLHITPQEQLHEMCISPVWGSPSAETVDGLPRTVACTIPRTPGLALRDRLARGYSPRVTLHAEVDSGWRKTPILVADLDATSVPAGGPFVLFSGHHDTWYYGVMDNGGANATMLEVARLCAQHRDQWRRGLRLCFWSGHSQGRYSGSAWYADTNWRELEARCVAHVNIDSTGGMGKTTLHGTAAMTVLRAVAADAVTQQTGETYVGKRKGRAGDDSFGGIGIPSMFGPLSEQDSGPHSLGWWWHTPDDTLDKIDPANLARDTSVVLRAVWQLLVEPVLPLDFAAQADELAVELGKLAAGLGDRLPLGALLSSVALLGQRLRTLREAGLQAAAGEVDAINHALMRVSRAMVPIDYTHGDRFVHDPALAPPAWPTLEPLRRLAATGDGSDAAHLCRVSATRARNRVQHAVDQALQAVDAALPAVAAAAAVPAVPAAAAAAAE